MLGPGPFIAMASANERYAVHTTEIPMFRLQNNLLKLARPVNVGLIRLHGQY